MARANLVVAQELVSAFVGARAAGVRWFKCELDDVTIRLAGQGAVQGDAEHDLATLKAGAGLDKTPCFLLFLVNPEVEKQGWLLIAYVPDASKVRARMLYASGVDDVKQALGHSNFAGSAHATTVEEIGTVASLTGGVRRDHDNAPLTEAELLAKEETAQMAAPDEARAKGMGMVPFALDPALLAALQQFADKALALLVFQVGGAEQLSLCTSAPALLSSATISKDEPRFYLSRQHSGNVFFVFSCPEQVPVKKRMLYSSSKPAVMAHLQAAGIAVTKNIELIGDVHEVDERIAEDDVKEQPTGKIVQTNFARPQRPGRGAARIIK
jgi:hypothetical protein